MSVWDIIEDLNETAHDLALDTWVDSDNAIDEENAEDLREKASAEQQEYFRDLYYDLPEDQKELIRQNYMRDREFREQFETYYGGELD